MRILKKFSKKEEPKENHLLTRLTLEEKAANIDKLRAEASLNRSINYCILFLIVSALISTVLQYKIFR